MKITRFEVNPFGETMYILWSEISREAFVVDPGMMNEAERKSITDFIANNGLSVRKILLTHMHIDHVASANWLAQTCGAHLCASDADDDLVQAMPEQVQRFRLRIEPPEIALNEILRDNDMLSLDNEPIHVLATPGHTQGGLSFYLPMSAAVLTGDTLFAGSIGRTDLPGGNFATLISSIKKKLLPLPADTIVLPGHGDTTTIGRELHFNPYLS